MKTLCRVKDKRYGALLSVLLLGVSLAAAVRGQSCAEFPMTTSGVITEFPIPTPDSDPYVLTAGPDGNLWFTESEANQIGRITPSGEISEFPIASPGSFPIGIAAGPDGNLWFTEFDDTTGNK